MPTKLNRLIVSLNNEDYKVLLLMCEEYKVTKSEMVRALIQLQNERTPVNDKKR